MHRKLFSDEASRRASSGCCALGSAAAVAGVRGPPRERRRFRLHFMEAFLVYSLRMAMLPIVQEGDPVLRAVAQPVPPSLFGSEELAVMLRDMADTLDGQ